MIEEGELHSNYLFALHEAVSSKAQIIAMEQWLYEGHKDSVDDLKALVQSIPKCLGKHTEFYAAAILFLETSFVRGITDKKNQICFSPGVDPLSQTTTRVWPRARSRPSSTSV